MAGLIEVNLHPDTRTLRQFGVIAFVGFGLLALAALREKAIFGFGLGVARLPLAVILASVGISSGICSLVYPAANRPLNIALSALSFPIGYVLSFLIMGVLFYVVFGIVAMIMRFLGRDPMNRSYDPEADSYWIAVQGSRDNASYFRQS